MASVASFATVASSSACTATGSASLAATAIPSRKTLRSALGKSSVPLDDMNALKPITPHSANSDILPRLRGVRPPHSAKSNTEDFSAAARFSSKLGRSRVGGLALSGISKTHVAPPAAEASEPVAQPSQSVRPGSL